MKEALDVFASKLTKRNKEEEEPQTCAFDELSYEQTVGAVSDPMFCVEPRISIEANDLTCEELRISLVGKLKFNQESRTKPLFDEISNVANSMFSEEATMSTKAKQMFNEEMGNGHVTPMFGEGKRISIAAFS